MELPRTSLFGLPLSRMPFLTTVSTIATWVSQKIGGAVYLINVHTLTEATSDIRLQRAFESSLLPLPDGVPLKWASKILSKISPGYGEIPERVCGPDLMDAILRKYPEWNHGFLGSDEATIKTLIAKYQLTQTVQYSPPYRSFSDTAAKEDWETLLSRGSKPSLVWVGLGAPKQEYWIELISKQAPDVLFFGVGAAFDFLAGTKARAPRWMQKLGIEWLHRLLTEPKRLFSRYLHTNSRFLGLLAQEIFRVLFRIPITRRRG